MPYNVKITSTQRKNITKNDPETKAKNQYKPTITKKPKKHNGKTPKKKTHNNNKHQHNTKKNNDYKLLSANTIKHITPNKLLD